MEEKGDGFLIIGICIGMLIGLPLWGLIFNWGEYEDTKQLGQSICEEEYGMDFESYINKVLKCKPFTESYDGIKVEIPKAQTQASPKKAQSINSDLKHYPQ